MVDSVKIGPAKPVPFGRFQHAKGAAETGRPARAISAPTAQSLSLAAALAQKGPPFDAGKVASLKAAIASGTYKVDLASVADGIIRFGGGDLG
jgi:negative regulator of flagellin synthesis FlgM